MFIHLRVALINKSLRIASAPRTDESVACSHPLFMQGIEVHPRLWL